MNIYRERFASAERTLYWINTIEGAPARKQLLTEWFNENFISTFHSYRADNSYIEALGYDFQKVKQFNIEKCVQQIARSAYDNNFVGVREHQRDVIRDFKTWEVELVLFNPRIGEQI